MKKNKKLLILVNDLNFFISHRLPIAEAALEKKYDVVIGYGELGGGDLKLLVRKGFQTKHIPMHRGSINPLRDIATIFYIWKFIKKERPDISHMVTIKPYLYGGIISRLMGVKSLVSAVSGLGSLFISKDIKAWFLRLILYPLYKLAFNHSNQKVIFQNKDDLKVFVDWGVMQPVKAKLLKGSGVNLENFKKLEESKGIPTVCFAARLIRDKGIYEFISAAKLIDQRDIKARFILAGDLDNKNPSGLSIDELNKLKKDSSIEYLGFQEDIPSLFANSHIVCLPSYREGLPKSLMEAAAAGRAIVTTDVPGCRDAIIPNKTGLLVPVKNYQKLADVLQWLIQNPKYRIEMGKAGRQLSEKEFAIEKIVQSHIDIYRELCHNKKN